MRLDSAGEPDGVVAAGWVFGAVFGDFEIIAFQKALVFGRREARVVERLAEEVAASPRPVFGSIFWLRSSAS